MVSPAAVPTKRKVGMVCDGACSGNGKKNARGGYACLYIDERTGKRKLVWGNVDATTNNRMELLAVILGLEGLKPRPGEALEVTILVDSNYVKETLEKDPNTGLSRLDGWIRKGWRNSSGSVANRDLWERLMPLLAKHSVAFDKVLAHSGHAENTLVNDRAQDASKNPQASPEGGWVEIVVPK